jgi:WD40 repeat protein
MEAVGWSPNGSRVVSSSVDGTMRMWDTCKGAQALVLRGHGGAIDAVGWSSDGSRVISGGGWEDFGAGGGAFIAGDIP